MLCCCQQLMALLHHKKYGFLWQDSTLKPRKYTIKKISTDRNRNAAFDTRRFISKLLYENAQILYMEGQTLICQLILELILFSLMIWVIKVGIC